MDRHRYLIVTADDFGIGPATSQGILDLAAAGRITCSVLLVTSPHAETAVTAWRAAGKPLELGWHPCLTLDRPIARPETVPSLVDAEGRFWRLGGFLSRWLTGRIRAADLETELRAQYERFRELVGNPPSVVNSHHHVQVFQPVGEILWRLLAGQRPLPYVRRVREPWSLILRVSGARRKRLLLSWLGRHDARLQESWALPGNDSLAGITDPVCTRDPRFFRRWLKRTPGRVVELTCHPGYLDPSLLGRDCTPSDGQLQRRGNELHGLCQLRFREACDQAGFIVVSPTQWRSLTSRTLAHAA